MTDPWERCSGFNADGSYCTRLHRKDGTHRRRPPLSTRRKWELGGWAGSGLAVFLINHLIHPSGHDVFVGWIGFCIGATVMAVGAVVIFHTTPTVPRGACDYNFKRGWWCSAARGHDGPCPLRPTWYTRAAYFLRGRRLPPC